MMMSGAREHASDAQSQIVRRTLIEILWSFTLRVSGPSWSDASRLKPQCYRERARQREAGIGEQTDDAPARYQRVGWRQENRDLPGSG